MKHVLHDLPAKVLERHLGVLGINGSGKSFGVRGTIIEPLLGAGQRVAVVDPVGVHLGARLDPTGQKPSGFDIVIFGGQHADFPITESRVPEGQGSAIAEVIATSSRSAIIDTSDMTVGDRTRFFTAFAETLLRRNRAPLHLVIDEAHLFAPQGRVADPQSGRMLHAANNLVSLGRARGLRVVLISQRPAKLHKDSLTQVHSLVMLKLVAPQDRDAAKAWIDGQPDAKRGEEVLTSLAGLQVGQGWLWAPEIDVLSRIDFPKIKTFDSFRAPDQEGDAIVLPALDTADIKAKLTAVAAEVIANDPAELKKRIADLEERLRDTADEMTVQDHDMRHDMAAEIAAAEQRGFDAAFAMGVNSFSEAWSEVLKIINPIKFAVETLDRWVLDHLGTVDGRSAKEKGGGTLEDAPPEAWHRYDRRPQQWPPQAELARGLDTALGGIVSGSGSPPPVPPEAHSPRNQPSSGRAATDTFAFRVVEQNTGDPLRGRGEMPDPVDGETVIPTRRESRINGKLASPAQLRIVDALAWQESIGVTECDRASLAFLADASPTSSTFSNNLGSLRTGGAIEYRANSRVALTEAGRRMALKPQRRLTHADIMRGVLGKLAPAQGRIIQHVAKLYPKDIDRPALAKAVGASPTSSTFANNLGRLRSLGLIVYRPDARVRADDRLYP